MRNKLLLGALVAVGLSLGAVSSVSAVINDSIELVNSTVGIAVSPVNSERLELKPGSVESGRFRVRQTGHETNDVVVYVRPLSMKAGGVNNEKDFEAETNRTKIAKWTTFTVEGCDVNSVEDGFVRMTMRPQEECFVDYTIRVPWDALGGSQNASIKVVTVERDTEISVAGLRSRYSFAYALYTDIDGPGAFYQGKVIENNIPCLLFSPPLITDSLVENTGNLDFITYYDVRVNNYFTGKQVYDKSWSSLVMADSKYASKTAWEDAPALGLFMVTQDVKVLDEVSSLTKFVLIIPIWLVIIIIGVILLLIWAIVIKIREHRRNRR